MLKDHSDYGDYSWTESVDTIISKSNDDSKREVSYQKSRSLLYSFISDTSRQYSGRISLSNVVLFETEPHWDKRPWLHFPDLNILRWLQTPFIPSLYLLTFNLNTPLHPNSPVQLDIVTFGIIHLHLLPAWRTGVICAFGLLRHAHRWCDSGRSSTSRWHRSTR